MRVTNLKKSYSQKSQVKRLEKIREADKKNESCNFKVPPCDKDVPNEDQNPQFYCHKKANSVVDGEGQGVPTLIQFPQLKLEFGLLHQSLSA